MISADDKVAKEILEAAGLNEADIDDVPAFAASSLKLTLIVTSTTNRNWPSLPKAKNEFSNRADGNLEGGFPSNPIQYEQTLLRLLVNKLGDTEKSVFYHLLQLLQSHLSMKGVVVHEIITLVLRPLTHPSAADQPVTSPDPRYLAHAMSHANTSGNGSGSATAKKPAQVHSTIPARAGLGKSGSIKQKEKGKEKEEKVREKQKTASPFWGLLRARRGDEDRDTEEIEGSPGSRILDIVDSACSSSVLSARAGDESDDEDHKKGQGKLKVKTDKGKGMALMLGKGRPSIRPSVQKRTASLTSTQSTTSTTPSPANTITSNSTVTPAFSLPTMTDTPQASSSPPRNRASSSSSNSSDSSASSAAHSTSTTATSPSPSVVASSPNLSLPAPLLPLPARPPSSLAALFSRDGSAKGSAKSVTFVDEPTVHYPYTEEYREYEYMHDQAQYGSGDEDDGGGNDSSSVGSGAGLSKNALAWELDVNVENMDLSVDSDEGVNLEAEL
ncbi:hypothetical protein FPV67DRAFT_1705063 [Lyophyllum atratum]|nr:hypothetical protein FPV67DRAFT_1705063 [Lyophyllum atratum]